MPGPVSQSYTGPMDPEEVELRTAIRVFTVEAPNDEPNGDTERYLQQLQEALDGGSMARALAALTMMRNALSDDTKALRVAAERFFGGDFRAP